MAISGSIGMDAVASGSFVLILLPISLVKSDWKLQHKKEIPAARPRSTVLPGFRHGMALSKMDFRTAFV